MTTDEHSLRWQRLSGIAGIVGATMWTLGDALLLGARAQVADLPLLLGNYAGQLDPDMVRLMVPNAEPRLAAGVFVADLGIVFYLLGLWHFLWGLWPMRKSAWYWWPWLTAFLLLCGHAWSPLGHGSFYFLGMAYKAIVSAPAQAHATLLELAAQFHTRLLVVWLLPIGTLMLGQLALGLGIALGRTAWPRWFALVANPLALYGIGLAIAAILPPPLPVWLWGAAFNIGWLVLYLMSTWLLWRGGRRLGEPSSRLATVPHKRP